MDISYRLKILLLSIFSVILFGSLGYYLIYAGQIRFMECLYMTVISITSVGFGEIVPVTGNVTAEIFTMVLLIFGMGVIAYALSTLTAIVIEGELTGILRASKMKKQISKLNGHFIVCGGGETGRPLISELIKNGEAVVVVEKDEEKLKLCEEIESILYVKGDASDDHVLVEAGIDKAKGLVVCLASDKDSLYTTMSARMLNKNLRIISRVTNPQLEAKLLKAGADKVVSPNFIGALRMASEMIRPTVVDFLDSMLRSKQGNLRINEITITAESAASGKMIMESGLRDKYNILVLGCRQDGGDIVFNPPPTKVLVPGTTLIVMGDVQDVIRAKETF